MSELEIDRGTRREKSSSSSTSCYNIPRKSAFSIETLYVKFPAGGVCILRMENSTGW